MVKLWETASLTPDERAKLLRRAEQDISELLPLAQEVNAAVKANGDAAVVDYTRKFDGVPEFTAKNLCVTPEQFINAREQVPAAVIDAIKLAHDNIKMFHQHQMPEPMWFTEVRPGIMAGERVTAIPSVGLYVPRGKGAFPSVMLMLSVPALVAGVERVVVVTPPAPNGAPDPASLVAAEVCGITEIYCVGGMQAIAALAYGTETIPKVAKVTGPGSSYVSAAKRLLYGTLDVGLPAGPSESIILCDETIDPRLAALDLLVEAEHGPESAALLVTHSRQVADKAIAAIGEYLSHLPEWRRAFVENVLGNYGGVLLTSSLQESVDFVNEYAPEHLEVLTAEPFITLNKIKNAGEILLGQMTPIPTANYALGLNAILPTGGFAKTFSSVSVWDFLKRSGVGYLSREGYEYLEGAVGLLADYEGFPAHAMAIRIRNDILGIGNG